MSNNFRIFRDRDFNTVTGSRCVGIPTTKNIASEPARGLGCLILDTSTDVVWISNGREWTIVGSSAALPTILQSIASLSPLAVDNLIYTQGVDNFASTAITSVGRTFLTQPSVATQQSILDLVPGVNVQIQNPTLQGISDLNPVSGNQILYTTSTNNFSVSLVGTFGLTFLNSSTVTDARTTLDVVQRAPTSNINEIALHDGNNGLLNTGVTIVSNNIGGALTDISASGIISATEIDTPSIINSLGDLSVEGVSIPSTKWSFVSTMQDVSTTSTPQFNGLSAGSQLVTSVATPLNATDAANKNYVDSAVAGGGIPFIPVTVATTAQLDLTGGGESGSGVGKTISGTIALIGTIDGVLLAIGNRVLVKDGTSVTPGAGIPNDSSSNGIYTVTDDGLTPGPLVVLTRATDADTPTELIQGKTVFVETGGTVNGGSSWKLTSSTPVTVDTDPIQFTQIGASQNLTAGDGIDITGNIISVDAEPTVFAFPAGVLDIVAGGLPISRGGTATTSFVSGSRVVATNAGNTALEATTLNPADVTTDANVQVFSNKTFEPDVTGNVLTLDGVNFSNAGASADGNILTIVGGSAQWAIPAAATINYERQVTVAQSGGDYTSIQAALVDVNAGTITGGVPTATNWVVIRVFPGLYTEVNPIVIPNFVAIKGASNKNQSIVTGTSAVLDIFQLGSACIVENIEARGNTTGSGFNISYAPTVLPVARIENCIARNCGRGYHVQGTGAANSSITLLQNVIAIVDGAATQVMTEGFLADSSGILIGNICTVSGFFGTPTNITHAYEANGTGTITVLSTADSTFTSNSMLVDAGAELRVFTGNLGNFVNTGIEVGPGGSIGRFIGIYILDGTATFPNQMHFIAQTGAGDIQGISMILRGDLVSLATGVNVIGSALSTQPGEPVTLMLGEVSIGLPGRGFELSVGEGDSHTYGMVVFTFNAATATFSADLANDLKIGGDGNTVTIFPSNTAGDIFYIGGDPNFPPYPGVKILTTVGADPAGGRSNGTVEPPTYHYVWEYWDGAGWVQFRIMTTDSESPYKPHRRDSFDLGDYQIRYGNIISTKSAIPSGATFISANTLAQRWVTSGTPPGNWTQNIVNGVNAFWTRVRLLSPLVTVPVLDKLKLHTNRFEANADGYNEFFGNARTVKRYVKNLRDFTVSPSLPPTGATDGYISDNIDLSFTQNTFSNAVISRMGNVFSIPLEVDTSHGMIFQWRWTASTGTIANVRWIVRWGYTEDVSVNSTDVSSIFTSTGTAPTESLTEQRITFDQLTGGNSKQVTSFCRIDVSDLVSNRTVEGDGDMVWLTLSRDGPADAYAGSIRLYNISVLGYAWNDGQAAT